MEYEYQMGQEPRAETAFEKLRRDIMNGVYTPGAPLPLTALAARYGVRPALLREAMARLEDLQLVVATPNKRWRVAPVTLADFEDLLQARLTLEQTLLTEAMILGSLEWEANLVAAHYRLTQAVPPLGAADTLAYRQTWMAVHDGFHLALLAGAKSNWLKTSYAQLMGHVQRHHQAAMARFQPTPIALEPLLMQVFSIPRHTELMVAALDRDSTSAADALQRHNDVTHEIFRSFLVQD
jgi:DNA-binding GntR family transcriptional regulator